MVKHAWLFTLSACPVGRSMGTILNEIKSHRSDLSFRTVYLDVETDLTNLYRVKKNPTTLFLDEQEKELGRIVGFKETDAVLLYINQLNDITSSASFPLEENQPSKETYTLFLLQGENLKPVLWEYDNLTSVRAPRITAIQLLLRSKKEGYINPFPPSCKLEYVDFKETNGRVVLKINSEEKSLLDMNRAVDSLSLTLKEFGIQDLKVEFLAND
ncbi:hypothetical protein [Paenibacillus sp. M-152]|uniref:hypothetical protein n=1 Tax=Paenibacillus sp. M-152 TaxID=2487928 RepID=UPI000F7166F2|nr:hypothetical protein [Paenibacillus sp. M-152]AZH29578.1 hypothetical protein EGM68_12815 [Paenibacillus sp. M-152]